MEDVIIVGAGVIGAAAAWHLRRSGRNVTVLEKEGGPGQGSTAASLGIVRFHSSHQEDVEFAYEGYHWWGNWHDWLGSGLAGGPLFVKTGSLILDDGDGYAELTGKNLHSVGVPFDYLDIERLGRSYPYLDLGKYSGVPGERCGALSGALWTPLSGYLADPASVVRELMDHAIDAGVRVRYRHHVTAIRSVEGGDAARLRVELQDGDVLLARTVLVAAGPPSRSLLHASGALEDFSILPAPLAHDMYLVPFSSSQRDGMPLTHLVDRDLGINVRPEGEALLGGLEHAPGTLGDASAGGWPTSRAPSRSHFEEVGLRMACRMPTLGIPRNPRGLVGFYDVTPDWKPIYDQTSIPGLFVAVGTSGSQFKTAPFVGAMMAQLIGECDAGRDHDRDPVIVSGRYTSVRLDMGAFSRNRRISTSRGDKTING